MPQLARYFSHSACRCSDIHRRIAAPERRHSGTRIADRSCGLSHCPLPVRYLLRPFSELLSRRAIPGTCLAFHPPATSERAARNTARLLAVRAPSRAMQMGDIGEQEVEVDLLSLTLSGTPSQRPARRVRISSATARAAVEAARSKFNETSPVDAATKPLEAIVEPTEPTEPARVLEASGSPTKARSPVQLTRSIIAASSNRRGSLPEAATGSPTQLSRLLFDEAAFNRITARMSLRSNSSRRSSQRSEKSLHSVEPQEHSNTSVNKESSSKRSSDKFEPESLAELPPRIAVVPDRVQPLPSPGFFLSHRRTITVDADLGTLLAETSARSSMHNSGAPSPRPAAAATEMMTMTSQGIQRRSVPLSSSPSSSSSAFPMPTPGRTRSHAHSRSLSFQLYHGPFEADPSAPDYLERQAALNARRAELVTQALEREHSAPVMRMGSGQGLVSTVQKHVAQEWLAMARAASAAALAAAGSSRDGVSPGPSPPLPPRKPHSMPLGGRSLYSSAPLSSTSELESFTLDGGGQTASGSTGSELVSPLARARLRALSQMSSSALTSVPQTHSATEPRTPLFPLYRHRHSQQQQQAQHARTGSSTPAAAAAAPVRALDVRLSGGGGLQTESTGGTNSGRSTATGSAASTPSYRSGSVISHLSVNVRSVSGEQSIWDHSPRFSPEPSSAPSSSTGTGLGGGGWLLRPPLTPHTPSPPSTARKSGASISPLQTARSPRSPNYSFNLGGGTGGAPATHHQPARSMPLTTDFMLASVSPPLKGATGSPPLHPSQSRSDPIRARRIPEFKSL